MLVTLGSDDLCTGLMVMTKRLDTGSPWVIFNNPKSKFFNPQPGSQGVRPPDELRATLLRSNVTRGRRMVCYDGSGVAAAKLAFVLSLLGHDDVAVYDGGWAEWGDRLDLPVDR